MPTLRLFVAWLVMAALPLQGLAAASMLFCGQAASKVLSQAAEEHASHDHAAHAPAGSHHGKVALADGSATNAAHLPAHDGGTKSPAGDEHACPVCASCCHLVALLEAPTLNLASAPPLPPPFEGPSRVVTREAPAPDKPPRA